MPSRDGTGRRLSGAEQKRKAEAARLALEKIASQDPALVRDLPRACTSLGKDRIEHESVPIPTEPPPRTVAEIVRWAAQVQARAAQHAAQGHDPGRVRAVTVACRSLGKLRTAAQDSEYVVGPLRVMRGVITDPAQDEPPRESMVLCAWAAHRLASLVYEAATASAVDPDDIGHRARALDALGAVHPVAEIQAFLDEIRDGQ